MGDSEKTPLLSSQHTDSNSLPSDGARYDPEMGDGLHTRAGTVGYTRRVSTLESVLPISLSWSNVQVSVTVPGKKKGCCGGESIPAKEKLILKGVNGLVKPGTLLAIMGASGAGKSTLLNVLTHRNTKSYTTRGEIRVNGWQIGDRIKNVSAYVQQDDIFIGTLTVREQLQFRALLRMDKKLNTRARLARVEEVLEEMGLSNVASSRIGNAGGGMKGISGGERKRLSFASEALSNPPLFFCDEPTSGLDSFMAQNIVQTLQKMASRGRAILCTIHQPSSEIFAMFNQILLLAEGRVAFMGGSEETMKHFEGLNFPCPPNYNPADHYILTLAIVPGKEEECRKQTHAICDAFDNSGIAVSMTEENDQLKDSTRHSRGDELLEQSTLDDSRYQASWLTQWRYLFWRAWISQFRDMILFRVRVMQSLVSGIVLGLVYFQLELDQKGVMNINGAVFVVIVNTAFSNMFAVINSFPIEMGIFLREYGSQLYRADVYYLTKSISEIPVFLLIGTVFITVIYWMMGLYEAFDAYLVALGVLLLTANTAIAFGYLISTIAGSVTVALAVAPPLLIPFMLFGGFFLNADSVPVYFIWLKYLSWFKYATEILMVNQWDHIDHIPCGNSSLPANASACDPGCLFPTGDSVLKYNSFDKNATLENVLALVALIVGFRLISYIALVIRAIRSKE